MPAITPVTTFTPAAPTAANAFESGVATITPPPFNTVEVYGRVSAGGAETGYLLRYEPEANSGTGRWQVYGPGFSIDSAAQNGCFRARYAVEWNARAHFQVYIPAALTVGDCQIRTIRL